MRTSFVVSFAIALSVWPSRAVAQDDSGVAAFLGMALSPPGAFAPRLTPAMLGVTQPRLGAAFTFGSRGDLRAFGVSATLGSRPRSAGALSAGFLTCDDDCDDFLLIGGSWQWALTSAPPVGEDFPPGSGRISAALDLSAGLGTDTDFEGTAYSGILSVPLTLVLRTGTAPRPTSAPPVARPPRVGTFVAPGVGFGGLSSGGATETGFRAVIGGGIGVWDLAPGIAIGIGVQRIFLEDSDTLIGFTLSWYPAR